MAQYLFGVHPALEAFKSGLEIERAFLGQNLDAGRVAEFAALARQRGVSVERVGRDKLDRMVDGGVHQGIVLEIRELEYLELEDLLEKVREAGPKGLLLVLDSIEDPHNLGALVRSAFALGAQGVVIPKDRAAQVTPTAIKSSAGALAHLPIARVTNLARALRDLKEAGLWVVGADMSGDRLPEQVDFKGPVALVIGNEGQGIRRLVLETCDFKVRIPMGGPLASLNASVAGAILLYEVDRQRRGKK